MKHNYDGMGIDELCIQKATWLQEYRDLLETLAIDVWEFGKKHKEGTRLTSVLVSLDYNFLVHQDSTMFDPKKNQVKEKFTIVVTKGGRVWYEGKTIALYSFYTDQEYTTSPDPNHFVVPGDWLDLAQKFIDSAHTIREQKFADEEEKQVNYLKLLLLEDIDI